MTGYITNGSNGIGSKLKRSFEECIRLNKRYCTVCGEDKDFSAFGTSTGKPFNIASKCKECTHVPRTELKRKPNGQGKPKVTARTLERNELKKRRLSRCSRCKNVKPFEDFFPAPKNSSAQKWPVSSRCRQCDKESRTEKIMKMTPEELQIYRKNRYNSVLRYAKNNPEKAKAMLQRQNRRAKEENRPGYIKTLLYNKLWSFKEMQKSAKERGFTPSDELMEAGKALNMLNLKIEDYGKTTN